MSQNKMDTAETQKPNHVSPRCYARNSDAQSNSSHMLGKYPNIETKPFDLWSHPAGSHDALSENAGVVSVALMLSRQQEIVR